MNPASGTTNIASGSMTPDDLALAIVALMGAGMAAYLTRLIIGGDDD